MIDETVGRVIYVENGFVVISFSRASYAHLMKERLGVNIPFFEHGNKFLLVLNMLQYVQYFEYVKKTENRTSSKYDYAI